MTELRAEAHAKLNLTLDVLRKREDGYHDLDMVMQEIALGDEITLTMDTDMPWTVKCDRGDIPVDDSNLVVKAARLFLRETGIHCGGIAFEIKKRTPSCAGMGGGSADGAAVLRLLYAHYGRPIPETDLYRLAEAVGSDVPFALFGGTARAEEKGQKLSRLPALPPCRFVICKPGFPISTPELYHAIDREQILERPDNVGMLRCMEQGDLKGIAAHLYNVFEPVVGREHLELGRIKQTLLDHGALGAAMTGSGPTMFGLFEDPDQAESAYSALKAEYSDTFLSAPV